MAGEWSQALDRFRTGMLTLEKNGDEYRARSVRLYQAWAHLHMLDFDGVQRLCASSYPNSERAAHAERPVLGDPIPIDARICLILRGSANLGAGDTAGAKSCSTGFRPAWPKSGLVRVRVNSDAGPIAAGIAPRPRAYLAGREPMMRMSTSLLALCCQSGVVATLATPISARSRSIGSRSLRMSPFLIARFTSARMASQICT
jgi:hypothetical protein